MSFNIKKISRITCRVCVKFIRSVPVVIIFGAIGWSYYVYVIKLCFVSMDGYTRRAVYLIPYHALLVMVLWSYYQTVMTGTEPVPEQFRLTPADEERLLRTADRFQYYFILEEHVTREDLPVYTRRRAYRRYCKWCRWIKPDRCHHCLACNTCVLKRDHHCPWMDNCIGFANYKFFLLFLCYAALYCTYIALSSFHYVVAVFRIGPREEGYLSIVSLFWVSLVLGVSLTVHLVFHCRLMLLNQTTHEFLWPPRFVYGKNKEAFSMTPYANFCEVFGDSKLKWFLPVFTTRGDGVTFYVSPLVVPDEDPPAEGAGTGAAGSVSSLEDGGGELETQALMVHSQGLEPTPNQQHFAGLSGGLRSALDVRLSARSALDVWLLEVGCHQCHLPVTGREDVTPSSSARLPEDRCCHGQEDVTPSSSGQLTEGRYCHGRGGLTQSSSEPVICLGTGPALGWR